MKKFAVIAAVLAASCGPPQGDAASPGQRNAIQNKGSDTLLNVAQAWAEAYGTARPDMTVAVTGGGSGTGISSLINGTVDIANSSRQMRPEEIEAARARGQEPVEFIVGYDALAIFLNEANPIDRISIATLKAIYGEGGEYESWSDLGVQMPRCSSGEIVRVSRQNNSGTYEYFREAVLGDGDFKLGSRDLHGSKDVVELVSSTPCAIGYSGLAYATHEVKMPCLESEGGACVVPSVETASDGSYPIARPLFMYTAGQPEGALKEYMDYIMSDEGQCIIQEKGYAPIRDVTCA